MRRAGRLRTLAWAAGMFVQVALLDSSVASAAESERDLGQVEERIRAAVEQWFTALARTPVEPAPGVDRHVGAGSAFEVDLIDTSPLAAPDVHGWLRELRPDHVTVEYRVATLRIKSTASNDDLYDTRFAVERRSEDAEGLTHVARWQQHWRVRVHAERPLVIISIESESRLVFPSTGAQMICY